MATREHLQIFQAAAPATPEAHAEIPSPRELTHDSEGRIWQTNYQQKGKPSVLLHDRYPRAVLTRTGQEFLAGQEQAQRRLLLHSAFMSRLSGQDLVSRGTEGKIRKVDDLPYTPESWWQTFLGALTNSNGTVDHSQASLIAIEKTFIYKSALKGWEMALLIDELSTRLRHIQPLERDSRELRSINILAPLGGTETSLFMPFIEGETLETFWKTTFNHHEELAKKLIPALKSHSMLVRQYISGALLMTMLKLGYDSYDNSMNKLYFGEGYKHYVHVDDQKMTTKLNVFIDVHPFVPGAVDCFRNWMLPPATLTECNRIVEDDSIADSDKVMMIVENVSADAIIFDPLYIRKQRGLFL